MEEKPAPSEPIPITDWVSTVSSAIAAAFALVTLVTVYVAARQVLTERRAYRVGLSAETLGPWRAKVKSKQLFGFEQKIATPIISLRTLMKREWQPQFTFPSGFDLPDTHSGGHVQNVRSETRWAKVLRLLRLNPGGESNRYVPIDMEKTPARASWVNFIQALGLRPEDEQLYKMNPQAALVNGIIPMRWTGKDLVGIANILGFQSYETKPSYTAPMALPMQWSGPLGWLQFRENAEGCVVEFRRRALVDNQLSDIVHDYYRAMPRNHESHHLTSRLWWSTNGMALKGGKALYLGGADTEQVDEMRKDNPVEGSDAELERFKKHLGDILSNQNGDRENPPSRRARAPTSRHVDALFDDLMRGTFSSDEISQKLQNVVVGSGDPMAQKAAPSIEKVPDFLQDAGEMKKKRQNFTELLIPAPGLLSVIFEGELADSRGLDIRTCTEYRRILVETDKLSEAQRNQYPFCLGDLRVDKTLLAHIKEAIELLKPDGYFFTPTMLLLSGRIDIFKGISRKPETQHQFVFPPSQLGSTNWPTDADSEELRHAMLLCNEFQKFKTTLKGYLTIDDMVVTAKASYSLRKQMRTLPDLSWAMLVCPKLYFDLATIFEQLTNFDILEQTVTCKDEVLECSDFMTGRIDAEADSTTAFATYDTPLCKDGEYTGREMLAAFTELTITDFWLSKSWVTDVGMYDAVIPQTITMC